MYVYSTGEKAYIGNKSDTKPPGQSGDVLVEIDKDLDVRKVYKYDGSSWILKNTVDNHGSINDDVQGTSELDGVYTQLGEKANQTDVTASLILKADISDVETVDQRVSTIIAQSGTSSTEVVDARGNETVLSDRLSKIEDGEKILETANLYSSYKGTHPFTAAGVAGNVYTFPSQTYANITSASRIKLKLDTNLTGYNIMFTGKWKKADTTEVTAYVGLCGSNMDTDFVITDLDTLECTFNPYSIANMNGYVSLELRTIYVNANTPTGTYSITDIRWYNENYTNLGLKLEDINNQLSTEVTNRTNLGKDVVNIQNSIVSVPYSEKDRQNKNIKDRGKILALCNYSDATVTRNTIAKSDLCIVNDESIKSSGNFLFSLPLNYSLITGDVLNVFMYVSLDTITNMTGYLTVECGSAYTFNKYVLKNGWNLLKCNVQSNATVSVIKLSYSVSESVDFYFDSVFINRKYRPKILINFDNGAEANMYGKVFPLMTTRNFVGTINIGAFGDGSPELGMTLPHFREMINDGWDYALYSYDGRTSIDQTNIANVDAMVTGLNTTIQSSYLSNEVSMPVSYFCPDNTLTYPLMLALKKVGFKMARYTVASIPGNIMDYYDDETFGFTTLFIGSTSCTDAKTYLDSAISSGSHLALFTHQVLDSNPGSSNTQTSVFEELLDYIKTKVDAGLCEVVTFKDFYESSTDSIREVSEIDYNRILDSLKFLSDRLTAHGI